MSNNNELNINFNIKITKKHLTLALIAIVATSMIIPYQIYAQNQGSTNPEQNEPVNAPKVSVPTLAALTNVIAMPTNNLVSTKSYYVIAFTTATTGTIKTIDITYPAGFNVANAMLIEASGIGAGTISVSGQIVTYTVASPVSVSAGTNIMIMISQIVNAFTTSNQVTVTTKDPSSVIIDGPTLSSVFTLQKVTTGMISTGAVTLAKLAANSVDGSKIVDGSVSGNDILLARYLA